MAISPLASSAASGATASRATLADNFETFLTLLTEQMKNQDPLSPMDSTQFVNQLVQFSGVEQQINQNSNLETLIGLQLASSQTTAASYLGKDVTVASSRAALADGEARWTYTLPREAESAKLVIENADGKLVYTGDAETGEGAHGFVWDGRDNVGAALPEGVYRLGIAALDADGKTVAADITTSGRVASVEFSGGEPLLKIGAMSAPLADIRSLREPAPPEI